MTDIYLHYIFRSNIPFDNLILFQHDVLYLNLPNTNVSIIGYSACNLISFQHDVFYHHRCHHDHDGKMCCGKAILGEGLC